MASAELGGFIAFVAAALSAMTDTEIVTKEEYDVRQIQANSGIGPSYTFKGRLDVPRLIEQTYADTQEMFIERNSPIDVIVREEITRELPREPRRSPKKQTGSSGFWDTISKVATDTVISVAAAAETVAKVPAYLRVPGFEVPTGIFIVPKKPEKPEDDYSDIIQVITSSSDGRERFLTMSSDRCTILQLKERIREEFRIESEDQCLSFQGIPLDDTSTLANYNIRNNSVIKLSVRVKGGGPSDVSYLDDTHLDPTWDYDFTDIDDGDTEFMRGGHRYYRPCGWKRIAIKVKKYPDGEAWLGHNGSAGEWAVTYHGTNEGVFNGICREGYIIGDRQRFEKLYGKCVYSASRIAVAEREEYATKFEHHGSWYKGVFQNRVNPDDMIIPKDEPDYRLCQNVKSIRPYGLCVKKV